jgi:DNA-binding transcriptional MerR regulator
MRIGELAAMLDVSVRTIRHYHQRGLLPEPERRSNGYRDYRLADAVRLARIRRLVGVGLSLDAVERALAAEPPRDLVTLLDELDADLARQEREIRRRRARLAELREAGVSDVDELGSVELTELTRAHGGATTRAATVERDLLALADTVAAPRMRRLTLDAAAAMAADTAAAARVGEVYRRMENLADEPVDDACVEELAAELANASAAGFPPELLAALRDGRIDPDALVGQVDLPAAQRAVIAGSLRHLARS